MTLTWTTATVPGAMTGTPADTNTHPTVSGRCERCERQPAECGCPGIAGNVTPAPGD
jgi:hypothetical protein